jgi:hypothetical protein
MRAIQNEPEEEDAATPGQNEILKENLQSQHAIIDQRRKSNLAK